MEKSFCQELLSLQKRFRNLTHQLCCRMGMYEFHLLPYFFLSSITVISGQIPTLPEKA